MQRKPNINVKNFNFKKLRKNNKKITNYQKNKC